MTHKIRFGVGLLILTDVPKMGRAAVLQVRGYFNTEEMRPQYYAGGCQVTVYGGINQGESSKDALLRETKEELGPAIAKILKESEIFKVADFKRGNERGVIYTATVHHSFLKKIRLGPDSGGLRLIKKDDLKKTIDLSKLKSGVKNRFSLAVFPDTYRVIKKAFQIFK